MKEKHRNILASMLIVAVLTILGGGTLLYQMGIKNTN